MLNRCATPRALPTRKFAVPYYLAHHVYRIHNSAGEDHLGDALHEDLAHVLGVGRDGVQSSRDVLHRESILRRRTPTSGRVIVVCYPVGDTRLDKSSACSSSICQVALQLLYRDHPLTGKATLANACPPRLDTPRSCRLPVHAAAANAHPCTDANADCDAQHSGDG